MKNKAASITVENSNLTNTTTVATNAEEEVIGQITLAGLRVLMVRNQNQIIYKLPDNMSVHELSEQQRSLLMAEIDALHAATMATAAASTGMAGQTANKPIAPKQEGSLDIDQRYNMTPTSSPSTSQPQTPQSQEAKTTRKYIKTGKYSKKKQMQQQYQQQQQQFAQAPQYNQQPSPAPMMFVPPTSTPNIAVPAPATSTNMNTSAITNVNISAPNTPTTPVESVYSATSSNKHIYKRLPEENFQNQEVKGRVAMALQHDHISVNTPDIHKPFDSPEDAIARLLPYHVYRIPQKDLASTQDNDVEADALAMQIFKRRAALFEKFSNILNTEAKNPSALALTVQAERHLSTELRTQLVEQQAQFAAEQAAQQELLRAQAEKARLAMQNTPSATVQSTPQPQSQQQQQQQPQQPQTSQPQQQPPVDALAQAAALFQSNPRLASQYSQLSPELQQQLLQHRDQLAAQVRMIQQQRAAAAAATSTNNQKS
ncbi:hypothetical protein INT44_007274 [Umbelopsis vinacea]|uniref:GLTSCR protein conserved domain-containing protein n=1 Tax=Umbelopsis vinacea TaxID=44442 RepID=A0A8H7PMW5_9FUNG|nr:hypothetical protein INT44_007274 [Umbelopsis vinacea]